jgi:hypothetical protein
MRIKIILLFFFALFFFLNFNILAQPGPFARWFGQTSEKKPTPCNTSDDCKTSNSSGSFCDLFLPSGGKAGSCYEPCDPTKQNQCTQGYICNVNTSVCEPSCSIVNGIDPCLSRVVAGGSQNTGIMECSAKSGVGYCQLKCNGNQDCPENIFICSSSTNGFCVSTQQKGCGNGIVEKNLGETCDEGKLGISCSATTNCPTGWTCPASGSGPCVPKVAHAGNGQAGHCDNNCKSACAVFVDYNIQTPGDGSSWTGAVKTIADAQSKFTGTTQPTCPRGIQGQAKAESNNPTACPCGYGIWVKNPLSGNAQETPPISITQSMPIYGGFQHTDTDTVCAPGAPYDRPCFHMTNARADVLGHPLGQTAFSGTVFSGAGTGVNTVVFDPPASGSINVIFDGFQILNGGDSGLLINKNSTVTLNNLRIAHNNSTTSGGGIKNSGTLTLTNSYVGLNTAQTSGGGLSNEAGTTTISNTTFYGNGFKNAALPPICTAGYSAAARTSGGDSAGIGGNDTICPTGMTCPSGGGICIETPTCTSTKACPSGWQCPSPSGTTPVACTGSPTDNANTATTSGGAIANKTGATVIVKNSRIQANYAYGNGGGIYSNSATTVTDSLFAGNWASLAGGGIYLDTSGTLPNLDTSTFIDNKAYNQGGGGVYLPPTISNSSISNNSFFNNKGLYPRNNNNMAEWAGYRPNDNAINAISWGGLWSATAAYGQGTKPTNLTLTNNQACPSMAYEPHSLSENICPGTQDKPCGKLYSINPYPGQLNFEISYTCSSPCSAPLYQGSGCNFN